MSVFAAVMTGKGTGAIATIQLCGDSAVDILKQIFSSQTQKPVEFTTGNILLGIIKSGDKTIDQVTIGCESNNSYAINCHGNPLIVEEIMQLLRQYGVELLTAKQLFCKTSANNNTIALEAKLMLPKVKTLEGTRIILNQIDSGLPASAKKWLQNPPENIAAEAQEIIDKSKIAKLIISGCSIVLAGPPNTGKSTLLNQLCGKQKVIVADIKGTTRDWVLANCQIGSLAIELIDTAGLDDKFADESFLLLLTFMISVSVPSLALSVDVAMRRRTEDRLRRTQFDLDQRVKERTVALAEANIHLTEAQRLANLGNWRWDVLENTISWSDQLMAIYGLRPGQFKGTLQEFIGFIHPDDRAQVRASVSAALESGKEFSHEERIIRPDGSIRYLHSVGEVIRDESGTAVRLLGICQDVTERKEAERALHDSEQNYRLLLRGARDYAIYMLDVEGRVRSWNDGARRLKGYEADEILGRHFRIFLPREVRAGDMADDALVTAAREDQFEAETWLVRKDGSRFYASVVMDAIRNDAGELIGFAKLTRDITTQHEAQLALEQAREQVAQAQKMEALGQLTGGIAHDFNNLLMIVSGYAQILQSRLSEQKDMQAVEAIRAAANRGERLTRQLLAFSRRQQLTPVVVDLRQRIGAVRDMLVPSLRGNINLICDIEDKIWPVEVDLGELELALVNIAVNARDAMPDGGTITLSARNVVLKPGSAAGSLAGEFMALAVIDTGSGMPPEVLQRVFEPFYTTKPVGKGTGLGLSQVHGFANQSGGEVTVSSEPGRGTVVTIYLPRSATAEAVNAGDGAAANGEATRGTVLVVEDSRDVADVTSALLEQLGYRVVRAENAAEALRHLQQGIGVDLVLSDIVMPGAINGLGLAELCRERFPGIPVLLTSGFSDAAQAVNGRFDILRKPFELAALAHAIDVVLNDGNEREPAARAS